MKAVVCRGNGDIKYEDVAEPAIQDYEVLVSVKACGICGSDIPRALSNGAHKYPSILGHEFSGIVYRAGRDVLHLKPGDHVAVAPLIPCHSCEHCINGNYSLCDSYSFIGSRQQGAMADYVAVPEKNTVKILPDIPFISAALFEPSTVSLHGLFISDFKPNKSVAVIGSGIIGVLTYKWAKYLGASQAVMLGRSEESLAYAIHNGIGEVISTQDDSFVQTALKHTEGKGFDYVFDCAGTSDSLPLGFRVGAKKGVVCYIGNPSSQVTFMPDEWNLLNRKEMKVLGSWMSYSSPFPGNEWEMTGKALGEGLLGIKTDSLVTVFPMSEAKEAFGRLRGKDRVRGRIVLVNP